MESLYVCLFSNGHIKVGRSIDPQSRIAAHADRVACMGIELTDSFVVECDSDIEHRERALIDRCSESTTKRFQSEWFANLNFQEVCGWAKECAVMPVDVWDCPNTRWVGVIDSLLKAGWTKTALAKECGCGATTISRLSLGQQEEPMHSMGETLLRLLRESS